MKRPQPLRKSQIRPKFASLLLCATIAITLSPLAAEEVVIQQSLDQSKSMRLVASKDKAILEFPQSLSSQKAKSDALELAKSIGLSTTGERLGPNELIVNAPLGDLEKAVKSLPQDKSAGMITKSLYYMNGIPSQKTRVSLKSSMIVSYKPETSLDERIALETQFGLTNAKQLSSQVVTYDVSVPSNEVPELASKIWATFASQIKYAEPVFTTHVDLESTTALSPGALGDPLLKKQWHHDNDGTTENRGGLFDTDFDTPRSWNPNTRNTFGGDTTRLNAANVRTTTGYYGVPNNPDDFNNAVVTVAVFDSGTDINHEDWARNLTDNDPDPGGISVIDPRLGFDYLDNEFNPDPNAGDNHGTSVAGIIGAARNNGVGVSGIAPDIRLLSYRLVETGAAATNADFAAAIFDAAIAKLADIGNHSYGGLGNSSVQEEAFETAFLNGRFGKGMVNFVASGNDFTYMSYPALYESTFSVGAMDRDGNKSGYGSFGGRLDFTGFGDQFGNADGVLTLDISGSAGDSVPDSTNVDDPFGNYYDDFNGTSAASPSVAGVAALILAESPGFDAVQLFNVMANTADRPGDPLEYAGIFNNATRFQSTIFVTNDDVVTTETVIFRAGSISGYRKGFSRLGVQYAVDGFSPFFGYGRPNPYRALTTQYANSPFRDYVNDIPVDDEDPTVPTEWNKVTQPEVDLGELKLKWVSDFTTDFSTLFDAYFALVPDKFPDATENDFLGLAVELTREDPDSIGPWSFFQSRRVPVEEEGVIAPKEIGFEISSEVYGDFTFEYDFSPDVASPDEGTIRIPVEDSFPVILSMTRPSRREGFVSFVMPEATGDDEIYNPRGRYLASTQYRIQSRDNIEIFNPDLRLPLFVDITIRHEMGISDASTTTEVTEGLAFGTSPEYEIIEVSYNGFTIGRIYGDSDDNVVFPLTPAPEIERVDNNGSEVIFGKWESVFGNSSYAPEKGLNNLPFRTYRFRVPENIRSADNLTDAKNPDGSPILDENGENVQVEVPLFSINVVSASDIQGIAEAQAGRTIGTGNSYLPEADLTSDDRPFPELFIVGGKRDAPGYEIAQIKFWEVDTDKDPITNLSGEDLYVPNGELVSTRGTLPIWSPSGEELLFASNTTTATGINEIRTALSDSFSRQLVGDLPVVTRRNSTRLLQTIPSVGNPAGTDTSIIALAADGNSSLIGYIIADSFANEHVFIATQDGFDERALFPAVNNTSRDVRFTDIELSPFSSEILLSSESDIVSTNPTGAVQDLIISTKGTKLRGFRDLISVSNDTGIVFSAITTQGDRGIFLAVRNLSTPGAPNLILTLADFPNSDEYQPTISPDGRFLAFVSNTVDQEGGTVPPADALPQIYYSTDLRQLIEFGTPMETEGPITLPRDERLATSTPAYPGGRHPQFEVSNNSAQPGRYRLAFEGIETANTTIGQIAVATITGAGSTGFVDRIRFDSPEVSPFPVVPEVTDSLLSQSSRSDFITKGDGWEIVVNSTDSFAEPLTSRQGGALTLLSSGNSNTYGYFQSPKQYLRTIPPSFSLSGNDQFNQYVVRYYLRRTSANAVQAPIFRGRIISTDGQDTHEINVIPSVDANNPYTPSLTTFSEVDLMFQPNPFRYNAADFNRYYTVTFELLNNTPGSDPLGGYVLDRVDIFRVEQNAVEEIGTVENFEFATSAETDLWQSTTTAGSPAPTFSTNNGALSITVNNSSNTVASWSSKLNTVEVNPVGVEGDLYLRMRTDMAAGQSTVAQLPVIELTLQDAAGRMTATHRINGVTGTSTANSIAPTNTNDRRFYTYWRIAPELQNEISDITATFTVKSVSRPGTTALPVSLKNAEFDLIRIAGYPEVDPMYE